MVSVPVLFAGPTRPPAGTLTLSVVVTSESEAAQAVAVDAGGDFLVDALVEETV